METILILLMVLAIGGFTIQLSFFESKWLLLGWLVAVGVFVYAIHTIAIEQSYTEFKVLLQNKTLIVNLTVLQVIESLLGMLVAVFLVREHYGEPVKKLFSYSVYFPGIVLFPALFYFESFVFLKTVGVDFMLVASVLAIAFPLFLFGGYALMKYMIPEKDVRVELKFFLHLFQLIGGICLPILVNRVPVKSTDTEFLPLNIALLLVGGIVAIVILGFAWHPIKGDKSFS